LDFLKKMDFEKKNGFGEGAGEAGGAYTRSNDMGRIWGWGGAGLGAPKTIRTKLLNIFPKMSDLMARTEKYYIYMFTH